MWKFLLKLCVFGKSTLFLKTVYFLELQIFGQVSDCLSRKIFRNLAVPIVVIQQTQKSKNHRNYALNTPYWCKFLLDLDVFEKSTFFLKSVYFLELESLRQISDCVSNKFFWDLAEPIVVIQQTQKSENYRKYALNTPYWCKFS